MRVPARAKTRRGRVSRVSTIPAPIRGWNARDSVADMRPDDAYQMINFYPTPSDIMLRKGSAQHITGLSSKVVQTLAVYNPQTGNQKMWAFTDTGAIYDASSAGAPAATVTGLTNGQWQYVNFASAASNYLLCVNGVDDLRRYDGTSWIPINAVSTPSITNVTSSTLVNVNVHKTRTWYVKKNTLSMWYAATNAYSGALTEFPMQGVFKDGGYLVAMGTWTLDGGNGTDDLALFITSTGEVAVYAGTDPSSSTTWSLVGVFKIAPPIGYRCFMKLGSDLLILTKDGVMPASKALNVARQGAAVALSDRISGAMTAAADSYGSSFGWQMAYLPVASMLLVNIPVSVGLEEQYVMNAKIGSWARFQQWPAQCLAVFNDALYFGMTGEVRKAWTGTTDVSGGIAGDCVSAFVPHGSSNSKEVTMIRPIIAYDQNPSAVAIDVNVDYIVTLPTSQISLPQQTAGTWDSALWDQGLWGGSPLIRRDWYGATGVGIALAPHITITSTSAQFRLAAYDLLIQDGEVL